MSSKVPLLRLVRTATKYRNQSSPKYNLQISCHVKPNASSQREGIAAVGADQVEICVAAQPKDGEANAAVTKVIAEVQLPSEGNVMCL